MKSKHSDKISKSDVQQDKVNSSESQEAIAIVGMSGRFAKSANLQQLWQHLAAGDDLVEEATRWELADYDSGFNAADTRKGCSRYGSFVEDMDKFDPLFFNISGIEAKFMDPQHRVFMEEAWRALEDASALGAGADLSRCGVYAGCSEVDYLQLYEEDTDEKMPPQAWWGNSNSILAARIAYHLDMQGPAVAIDTACSSSLVAIHLACQGLRLGEIDMALAGGVTLMPTANFYLDSGRAGMLSTKGHCHTFDAAADGFVPGEGVGVVVLKRLSTALAAGDQIYGVIKGSGMNQDGASNGIVAPRGIAQEQLERDVYDRFSINPEHIDYVEAHGTGTALGDPIEFRALTNTFKRYTQKKNFCGIGSIKTNIGHTLTAAGVAGVIKVLLALQHKKIPPSLHFQKGNPAIDFDNSPFFVTTELTPWQTQDDHKRLAAISSFGFSGTNAHVVIEEAPEPARTQATAPGYLIVLSANNDAELKQQAQNLCEFLTDESVADISFSLLTGRRHFPTRLAVVAQDTEELKKALAVWLDKGRSSRVMAGTVTKSSFKDDKPLKDFGNQCIAQLAQEQNKTEHFEKEYLETLSTVAQLFIQGFQLQFSQLFQAGAARKISLPTYPFARGSYWFDKADLFENKTNIKRAETKAEQAPRLAGSPLNQASAQLHPLLHENTSTCFVTRFSSTFTGAEFFFADHQVQGNKVLPGVAHLEMARAAIAMAMELDQDADQGSDQCIQLSEVVWRKPVLLMDGQLRLHIELTPISEAELQFHIYSRGLNDEEILYSQGVGRLVAEAKVAVDIAALQQSCRPDARNADALYAQFSELGLNYGVGHQGLVALNLGLDAQQRPQVLAQLRQPETHGVSSFEHTDGLHPGMLDSALQASIGLSGVADAAKAGTPLPFSLASVAIYRALPDRALAWVRFSEGCQPSDPVQKLDISVCDEQGNPCVEFKGFSSRILKAALPKTAVHAETLLFQPQWLSAPIEQVDGELRSYSQHHVFLLGSFTQKAHAALEKQLPASITCKRVVVANGALAKRYSQAVEMVFADIQQLIASRPEGSVLVQVVISTQDNLENACFAGLSGLLKTAAQENPKLCTQSILLSEKLDGETLSELIQTNAQDAQAAEIRYLAKLAQEKPAREVKALQEGANLPEARPVWKDQGVYLITGGLGGLGLIFAREIAAQTTQATVILTGRSALDLGKQREIDQLIQSGLTVDYQIVNVAEREEVDALLASLQKKYAGLTAILHSAGVIQDNFIQNKTPDEIRRVLAPKVAGVVNLDEASQNWKLEQFICFSSSAGAFGNPGQADYAAANAFLDAYAHYRNELCSRGQRSGHTLSINWPLWQAGGMQVHPAVMTALAQKGLSALSSDQGVQALYRSAALAVPQVLVLCGQASKIRGLFASQSSSSIQSSTSMSAVRDASVADSSPQKDATATQPVYDESSLLSKVQQMLLQQVAGQLKLALDDVDLDSQLSEFGFDSISLTEMGNELNQRFQITLTPTLFFEYPTLGEFAGYLVKEHGDVIASQLMAGLKAAPAATQTKETDVQLVAAMRATSDIQAIPSLPPLSKRATQRVWKTHAVAQDSHVTKPENTAIAIIGISGCFPGAADVDQFWQNLDAGKDCITEIPAERWDWQSIYGDPATDENKTNVKWGGFIDGVDQFDPLFFGISPREALTMDPQQRLLMTHAWQSIEDAGYAPGSLSGTDTAVIVGTVPSGYSNLLERSGANIEAYTATGMAASVGPNRLSYLLNLHGPSEPIETACSSSLVAIHRAVELIRKGRCGMAIAGGINTLVTPDLYIAFSKSGMLCEDGRCKTFSDQANGYVRGEGAGMLVLKRLDQAKRDGDHIYGTILASSENHGGRANSLTAPNPNAQADLLVAAYREAGIDPRTVTYIEAHGTGTELGDPVEINGLKNAFKTLYQDYDSQLGATQCGVGSVKSNIGHLELSAGVAGVIKVLMQMQHQTLAKSLHCETLNPYIDLKDSPFFVVQEKQEWKNLLDAQGQPIPRRAGVSSFGFGGVNAHIVLEEYLPKAKPSQAGKTVPSVSEQNPAIILLSAKNSEQLLEQAQNLLRFVLETNVSNADLPKIAYTLQVGRDAMDERIAFQVTSVEDLIVKLQACVEDSGAGSDLFRGSVRQGKEGVSVFLQDKDAQVLINTWLEKGRFDKLLKLWVQGVNLDWVLMYRDGRPSRISLPTYPFARNSYWLDQASSYQNKTSIKKAATTARLEQNDSLSGQQVVQPLAQLHPLLHENTSNCFATRFSSTFTGAEFFFADHQVQGNKVLPGVAHLEMARAAIAKAMELDPAAGQRIELSEIVWRKPVMLSGSELQLHIELTPLNETQLQFHIYSLDANDEEILYSQGVGHIVDKQIAGAEKASLDIQTLQSNCKPDARTAEALYAQFSTLGLDYGVGHQGLVSLKLGRDDQQRPQVLAQLRKPVTPGGAVLQHAYVMHPGMLDSALQASIGLSGMVDTAKEGTPLPFALTSLAMYQNMPDQAYAWVRYSEGCQPGDSVQKLDISVCDEQGNLCIEFKGFSSRILKASLLTTPTQADTLLFQPKWLPAPIEQVDAELRSYLQHHVFLLGSFTQKAHAALEQQLPASITCKRLVVANGALVKRYNQAVERVFAEIQQLIASRPDGPVLVQVVISTQDNPENACFAGLSGLLKTASQEYPKLSTQCIELSTQYDSETLSELIQTNAQDASAVEIRYQENLKREVKSLHECTPQADAQAIWKDRGVYLITGGLGGLGLIFAREIAAQTTQATVILTGRSALDLGKQREIDQLTQAGLTVDYQVMNVAERDDVASVMTYIQNKYAGVTAILHCAGVIQDNFIQKKTRDEICQVLAPKVAGLVNLDEASQDLKLEQFICFSSSSGAFGNPGQADYAAANAFMDAYAHYRQWLSAHGQRSGQSLSINWPLWKADGMQVHAAIETALAQKGLSPLLPVPGIAALYRCVGLKTPQAVVMSGKAKQIRALLDASSSSTPPVTEVRLPVQTEAGATPGYDAKLLLSKVQSMLLEQVSSLLKISVDDLDLNSELSDFGFDSISLTEMGNQLNQRFQISVTPTIFFEYPTLGAFAGYLVKEKGELIAKELNVGVARSSASETPEVAEVVERPESTRVNKHASQRRWKAHAFASGALDAVSTDAEVRTMPIAIIGISGCFPGATDVDQFWQNLNAGKDCISEIPADRWDWKSVYGDPATDVNKTNIKWGGFIEGVDQFDSLFFGISPREAVAMDPQQRLMMTHAWQAIEDAGYAPSSLSGSDTAVIVGTVPSGYSSLLERSGGAIEAYTATGMAASVGPNRLSYLLNLHGPSEPIETACSSSLVAIHRAVELIRKGRCSMAIAGGINTLVTPDLYIAFSKSGMLCEDGRCKTFSAQANGYVRGEGAGMLVLKRLDHAERDGDHIYGTILASSENHGGRANSLTAPNPNAQADLIVAAYREANIDPRSVTYIEAHGTGTELGDPVEINGLKIAFKKLYQDYDSQLGATQCGVGSVKSNIGHLELSAGVAGVIKVLMQMKHQTLAKSLHCETLNPYIDLKDSPFYIVQEQQEWKPLKNAQGQPIPRRAGVSSFGFGGVNAHVVLEEYLPKESRQKTPVVTVSEDRPAVILLSAKNSEQLREQARNLLRFVSETNASNADLLNIAYTLQVGRDAMDERLAFLATSVEQLILKLKSYEQDASSADLFRGSARQGKEAIAIFLQDDDAHELTRTWLEKGKYEKLLKLWVKGLHVDWTPLYQGYRPARISLPTYPFARNSYWVTRELPAAAPLVQKRVEADASAPSAPVSDLVSAPAFAPAPVSVPELSATPAELDESSQEPVETPVEASRVLEILKASTEPADKRKVLLGYLRRLVANAIQIGEDEIDENGDFASDYGVDSMAGIMLIREIKNDLEIALYPRELAQIKSLSGLVEKMLEVFDEVHGGKIIQSAELPADAELNSKVEMLGSQGFNDQDQDVGPIGFILSNPRSGSTLLRTMLAGHPELFAPPELHLLNYATMQDRDALLKGTVSMSEGLQRAFMELHQMDADASRHYQQKMVDESWSIADVYGDLIQSAKGRLLIDKSPSYAGNPAALARAEVLFKRAKYIHLVRHPYAVIESFTRMRMDKLLSDEQVDRYRMAEEMWTRFNQNIEDFFAQVPDDRKLVVHYEELIKNPEATLQAISRFLEIEFHPEMLNPYANGRMTDGIYKESAQIGDPNFLNHNKIESDLADSWKNIQLPRALQVTTQAMAQKYGYALPSTEAKVESVPDAIPHVHDTISHTPDTISHVPDTKEYMVDVNGVTLAVCEWGNPEHPAVLCVHGLMDQGLVWKPVARDLVAQGYRVIAPDLRGHGCSAHLLPDERYYDVDAFVQDLKALVDHLRIERFTLVGHSLGSVIAARLAAAYPDHVQALILVETILIGADKPSDEQEYSIPDRDRFAHQPLQDIESAIERLGIFMPSHNEGFLRELAQRATVEATGGELMWRWDEQLRKRQFFSGPNAAFQFRKSYLEQLGAMAIPTLVLQADKSGHRRAADQKILNRALAHARSVQMRGGHNLHLEDPVTVAETIFSFIQTSSENQNQELARSSADIS